jgi:hypothetical protein
MEESKIGQKRHVHRDTAREEIQQDSTTDNSNFSVGSRFSR